MFFVCAQLLLVCLSLSSFVKPFLRFLFVNDSPIFLCVSLSIVRFALWKKAVIGGFCLLVAAVAVVVCVLCFRSKRGRETYSPPASHTSYV